MQSNLGSRTPRIMNNSVYEQIFRTQSLSADYCVSSYEHASPSFSMIMPSVTLETF